MAAECDGEGEEGQNRMFAIEERAQADLPTDRAEQLAEDQAEDDRAQPAREGHGRELVCDDADAGTAPYRPGPDREHQSVADVAEHHAEHRREEDRDEGRRVDGAVARQRQHAGDHFERAEQRRIVQHDRRGLGFPVLRADRRDDDLRAETALHRGGEVLQAQLRQPAFDNEQMMRGIDARARIQALQLIVQRGTKRGQPRPVGARQREPLVIQASTSAGKFLESRLDPHCGARQVGRADPGRWRQLVHARGREQ